MHSSNLHVFLLWTCLCIDCAARGFIRAMLQDEYFFVTSPSYLLDNTYTTSDHVM